MVRQADPFFLAKAATTGCTTGAPKKVGREGEPENPHNRLFHYTRDSCPGRIAILVRALAWRRRCRCAAKRFLNGGGTMIVLYTLVLFVLGVAKKVIDWRVRAFERRYSRAALAVVKLLREPVYRDGNGNRGDIGQSAKRQYQLGRLVQQRDYLEGKHDRWQLRAEKLGATLGALRAWKGRKLPYTLGALDVAGLLYLIDTLGAGEYANVRHLVQVVASHFTR
jgi:hypothetical protein